jgi:hypothetical protein
MRGEQQRPARRVTTPLAAPVGHEQRRSSIVADARADAKAGPVVGQPGDLSFARTKTAAFRESYTLMAL